MKIKTRRYIRTYGALILAGVVSATSISLAMYKLVSTNSITSEKVANIYYNCYNKSFSDMSLSTNSNSVCSFNIQNSKDGTITEVKFKCDLIVVFDDELRGLLEDSHLWISNFSIDGTTSSISPVISGANVVYTYSNVCTFDTTEAESKAFSFTFTTGSNYFCSLDDSSITFKVRATQLN